MATATLNLFVLSPPSLSLARGNGILRKEIYGQQLVPKSGLLSLVKSCQPGIVRASLERKKHGNKRVFLKSLLGVVGVSLPTLSNVQRAREDDQGVASSRMSYSRFLEYLDKDRVKKVDLFENGMIAIEEAVSPELGNRIQQVRLQLLGLIQELLQKFREKNIDFAAHNDQEDSG